MFTGFALCYHISRKGEVHADQIPYQAGAAGEAARGPQALAATLAPASPARPLAPRPMAALPVP